MDNKIPTIVCGNACTFFINIYRELYSLGDNEFGKGGFNDDDKEIISSPFHISSLNNIKMVSCGMNHTACCDFDGFVYSFGSNEQEQLGINKTSTELLKTYIPEQVEIEPISKIFCASFCTICLTINNDLYCFGSGSYGQLGLGENTLKTLTPQKIPNISDVKHLGNGENHIICRTFSNDYYCWGYNNSGQLGINNTTNVFTPNKASNWPEDIISFQCGSSHSLMLTLQGKVYVCGSNSYGQLGIDKDTNNLKIPTQIEYLPKIKQISCGYLQSMSLDFDGNVWLCGWNNHRQLAFGDKDSRYKFTKNKNLSNIIDFSNGGYHCFFKTSNDEIYGAGYNAYNQLGIETNKKPLKLKQLFKDNESLWSSSHGQSRQKSARK